MLLNYVQHVTEMEAQLELWTWNSMSVRTKM